MSALTVRGSIALTLALLAAACATAPSSPAPAPAAGPPAVSAAARAPEPPRIVEALPEAFESEDFVVTWAKAGDTAESLARRYLGDPGKAWMIQDYMGAGEIAPGQEVIVPRRPWNLSGVDPSGYQIVPILVYHNLADKARGRMVLAASTFEQQMRYLKTHGYRVIGMADFVEWVGMGRQLPRRAVVLTFDDGYRAFRQHAYPILKELGFTATLFVYTDYVGAGRNALSWDDLRQLAAEGFDVQAHSKTHGDLKRNPAEPDTQYARRLARELHEPQEIFQRQLGRTSRILAYPYGSWDEEVLSRTREAGYIVAFSVRRQGNGSFVRPLAAHRSQIYAEMTLEDFVKNLNVFQEEPLR
jgi:peptidoglycan/xylan/chitin deacetylase (PgdA/CDA1 family)